MKNTHPIDPSQYDATATYRGFRLQALYVLDRILAVDSAENVVFQPEGREDLAVYNEMESLTEIVQVKAYTSSLTYSDFKTVSGGSFFNRAVLELTAYPGLKIRIVSFGPVGPELKQWFGSMPQNVPKLARKLRSTSTTTDAQTQQLVVQTEIVEVNEEDLSDRLLRRLAELCAGIDPVRAFDALMYWIFESSETRRKIKKTDIIDRLNAIGRFLSETHAHQHEWYRSVLPIEDIPISSEKRAELAREFFEGASAQYSHILADIDVKRPRHLAKLVEAFHNARIVILHGASGQGKSTLAYRFLRDNYPDLWRFEVVEISGTEHALSIAAALSGHAAAMQIPIAVYLDVAIGSTAWQDLLRRLGTIDNIRVLLSIREEEWKRANIGVHEFKFETVDLTLTRAEGQELYEQLVREDASPHFPSFDSAWLRFGGEGPLLEFVHLVTHGGLLRDRLEVQVKRLRNDVRSGALTAAELRFLASVAVASAYGARQHLPQLADYLALPDAISTVALFEKEYLLRGDIKLGLVEGLHPIRSQMLAEMLTDDGITSWVEVATQCLRWMPGEDIEGFLLYVFSRRVEDVDPLVTAINTWQPQSWIAIKGTVSALIWLGIREFVERNDEVITRAHQQFTGAWWMLLQLDVTGLTKDILASMAKLLGEKSTAWQETQSALIEQQEDINNTFQRVSAWLEADRQPIDLPSMEQGREWQALGGVAFWIGLLKVKSPLKKNIDDIDILELCGKLDIDTLATVVLGLKQMQTSSSRNAQLQSVLLDALKQQASVVKVEIDNTSITLHFLVNLFSEEGSRKDGGDEIHRQTMSVITRARRLFPEFDVFASFGYGYQFAALEQPYDPTEKRISRENLPLDELVQINATLMRYVELRWRPDNWSTFATELFQLRQKTLKVARNLIDGMESHFRKKHAVNILQMQDVGKAIDDLKRSLSDPISLPRVAFDEWGFVGEPKKSRSNSGTQEEQTVSESIAMATAEYLPLLTSYKELVGAWSAFFDHSIHVIVSHSILDKGQRSQTEIEKLNEMLAEKGVKADVARLSIGVLWQAGRTLPAFQREFRKLCGHYIGHHDLTNIERDESRLYKQLWSLWYLYATKPNETLQQPSVETRNDEERVWTAIKNGIRKSTRSLDSINVRILEDGLDWDGSSALWISYDVDNVLESFSGADEILRVIRDAANTITDATRRELSFSLRWDQVVLVPLVGGRSLDLMAWVLPWHFILGENEEYKNSWWYGIKKRIPEVTAQRLEIMQWKLPRAEVVEQLREGLFELWVRTGIISDTVRIEIDDDSEQQVLQDFVAKHTSTIEGAFKKVTDSIQGIIQFLSDIDITQRKYLVEAVKIFVEGQDEWIPEKLQIESVKLSLEDIVEWNKSLKSAIEKCHVFYLYWIADALEEIRIQKLIGDDQL